MCVCVCARAHVHIESFSRFCSSSYEGGHKSLSIRTGTLQNDSFCLDNLTIRQDSLRKCYSRNQC